MHVSIPRVHASFFVDAFDALFLSADRWFCTSSCIRRHTAMAECCLAWAEGHIACTHQQNEHPPRSCSPMCPNRMRKLRYPEPHSTSRWHLFTAPIWSSAVCFAALETWWDGGSKPRHPGVGWVCGCASAWVEGGQPTTRRRARMS